MNRDWHETHRLPANAKLDQRIDWHIEHAAQCGCREIPDSVKKALEQRGIHVPPRRVEGR